MLLLVTGLLTLMAALDTLQQNLYYFLIFLQFDPNLAARVPVPPL